MHIIQKKLMQYHHGYFMVLGLVLFILGFALDFALTQGFLNSPYFQVLTILGALILGWGTGRCDQCAVSKN